MKKIKEVRRFMPDAMSATLFDALGPKYLVIISIHIKESQEIKTPPSRAIISVCTRVLFARRFIQITLTTNRETTAEGILLKRSTVSFFS